MIELAQGLFKGQRFEQGKTLPESTANIQDLFQKVMDVETLDGLSMDNYLDALSPESPLERIAYRL